MHRSFAFAFALAVSGSVACSRRVSPEGSVGVSKPQTVGSAINQVKGLPGLRQL